MGPQRESRIVAVLVWMSFFSAVASMPNWPSSPKIELELCKEAAFNWTVSSRQQIQSHFRAKRSPKSSSSSRTRGASPPLAEHDSAENERDELDEDTTIPRTTGGGIRKTVPLPSAHNRSPPLVCSVYGDPHIRTFDHQYQTCRIAGAWPLIDHPLFAIQITTSPISANRPQVTGVTKVTLLIRRFSPCGMLKDLIYSADAMESSKSNPGKPLPTTFDNDKSRSATDDGLVEILELNSKTKEVVIIEMDHVGARVYIGRSPNSPYLSLVIKFGTASTERQAAHLSAISQSSLCKSSCPAREEIAIHEVLTATGLNLTHEVEVDPDMTNADLQNETYHIIQRHSQQVPHERTLNSLHVPKEPHFKPMAMRGDPCEGTYGYYRLACLYDFRIKGITAADNACRFAQSFDHIDAIRRSSLTSQSLLEHLLQTSHRQAIDRDEYEMFSDYYTATSHSIHPLTIVPLSIMAIVTHFAAIMLTKDARAYH